jgi:hypothetical protein
VEWFEVAAVQSQAPRARIPSSSRHLAIAASKSRTRNQSRKSCHSGEVGIEGDHEGQYSTAGSIIHVNKCRDKFMTPFDLDHVKWSNSYPSPSFSTAIWYLCRL